MCAVIRVLRGGITYFQVLHPCDIEFVKSLKSVEDGLKVTATVSTIDVHLSASTVHTVNNVSTPNKICSCKDDQRYYILVYISPICWAPFKKMAVKFKMIFLLRPSHLSFTGSVMKFIFPISDGSELQNLCIFCKFCIQLSHTVYCLYFTGDWRYHKLNPSWRDRTTNKSGAL